MDLVLVGLKRRNLGREVSRGLRLVVLPKMLGKSALDGWVVRPVILSGGHHDPELLEGEMEGESVLLHACLAEMGACGKHPNLLQFLKEGVQRTNGALLAKLPRSSGRNGCRI